MNWVEFHFLGFEIVLCIIFSFNFPATKHNLIGIMNVLSFFDEEPTKMHGRSLDLVFSGSEL